MVLGNSATTLTSLVGRKHVVVGGLADYELNDTFRNLRQHAIRDEMDATLSAAVPHGKANSSTEMK
jgi:hypothetical protein